MKLSPFQKTRCLEVLDKINDFEIAAFFADPGEVTPDLYPDYFEIIKQPSFLNSVEDKLKSDLYDSVSSFKSDMNLIWSNAVLYNGPAHFISHFAISLRHEFTKLTQNLTDKPEIDWINQLSLLVDQLNLSTKIVQSTRSKSISMIPNDVNNNDPIEEDLTEEELRTLASSIDSLTSTTKIHLLLTCLKQCEPDLVGKKTTIDVNLAQLSKSTLRTLQRKLTEFSFLPDED